jgi:hypothetical protein
MARRMSAAQAASAPAPEETAHPATAPAPQAKSYVQELEELAALKDKGILTEEEFQAKKKQILNL